MRTNDRTEGLFFSLKPIKIASFWSSSSPYTLLCSKLKAEGVVNDYSRWFSFVENSFVAFSIFFLSQRTTCEFLCRDDRTSGWWIWIFFFILFLIEIIVDFVLLFFGENILFLEFYSSENCLWENKISWTFFWGLCWLSWATFLLKFDYWEC